jgi:hypothetical protein
MNKYISKDNAKNVVVSTKNETQNGECTMYQQYVANLEAKLMEFLKEAKEGEKTRASSLRARKLSLFLGEELPNFRRISVKQDKSALVTEDIAFKGKNR